MPHSSVTVYDLLLSCPGDVLDLKTTIEECIKSINATIGEINNMRVELKHWSINSFPQSGDKPQNILNKQFVTDCDMCIALLGTRFGTPTDNYDSGTEEEIETMLSQGKQVFLYFVERSIDPSTLDVEQYEKVKKFKEKYASKGLYAVVKSTDELRKEFQNALTMYLIKLVAPTTIESISRLTPDLRISSSSLSEDTITLVHSDFQNVKLVEDRKKAICNLISQIKELKIELSETKIETSVFSDEEVEKMKFGELTKATEEGKVTSEQFAKILGQTAPTIIEPYINDSDKNLVQNFCDRYGISLPSDFWNLGNLKKKISKPWFNIYNGDSVEYIGSDSEKLKHENITDLIPKISEFKDIVDYFAKIDNLYYASFFIENNGTTYDEDIDIRVFIEKGLIVQNENIPQPDALFIDEVVECEAPKILFAESRDPEIDDFSNYPVQMPDISPSLPYLFKSAEDQLKKAQTRYTNQVDNVFCYDIRENDCEDILIFNIPYLKQNTKMFFPSLLFFKTIPEKIRFEVRSKYSPNVYSAIFKTKQG